MNANNRGFLEKVKDLLSDAAEDLDDQTQRRLEQVRIEALKSAAETPSGFFSRLRWIVVGGFATATMTAAVLFFWLHTSPGVLPARNIEDFEILTSAENIDFYQNLDFYRWMAAGDNGAQFKGKRRNG